MTVAVFAICPLAVSFTVLVLIVRLPATAVTLAFLPRFRIALFTVVVPVYVFAVAPPWNVTVPPLTVTPPVPVAIRATLMMLVPVPARVVSVFVPVRPVAVLVRLRVVPVSTAIVVAAVSVMTPERVFAPPTLWMAPAPPTPVPLTEMALVGLMPPVSSSAAPAETVVVPVPRAPVLPACTIPLLTKRPPEKVLLPFRTSFPVPAPSLMRL